MRGPVSRQFPLLFYSKANVFLIARWIKITQVQVIAYIHSYLSNHKLQTIITISPSLLFLLIHCFIIPHFSSSIPLYFNSSRIIAQAFTLRCTLRSFLPDIIARVKGTKNEDMNCKCIVRCNVFDNEIKKKKRKGRMLNSKECIDRMLKKKKKKSKILMEQ